MRKRILSMVLTLSMVASMLPIGGITASAAVSDTGSFTVNDTRANTTEIVFGVQNWLVIGYNGTGVASESGSMTLLAKDNLKTSVKFHVNNNDYAGNNLKIEIDKLAELSVNGGLFKQAEQDAIKKITLTGGSPYNAQSGMAGDSVTDAILWPLDVVEANIVNEDIRKINFSGGTNSVWWLRSPGYTADFAAAVDYNSGGVGYGGASVAIDFGVRPAFKLNLSPVLFASNAVDSKFGTAGTNLSAVAAAPNGVQKLTILDIANHALATATTTDTMTAESTITVSYEGASTGKTLSAIVANKIIGAVTHYGKLVDSVATASGTASVTLPAYYDCDTMELKIFTETINGNNLTDYASTPQQVTVVSLSDEIKNESELSAAITAAATDGSPTTMKLGANITVPSSQIITNKNIILDLNGHTLSSSTNTITLSGTASLEVKDTSVSAAGVLSTTSSSTPAITNSISGSGNVTVSGGTVFGTNYAIWNQNSAGSVNVFSGEVSSDFIPITGDGIVNVSGGIISAPLASISITGISNISGGTLEQVNTRVLNISGNPTLRVFLNALTSKKVSITGEITAEDGAIVLNGASLETTEEGTVVATATDANHANASKFVLTNVTGETLMKSGADIVFAADIPTAPTIGTLTISNTFTAGHHIALDDLAIYKPTVTANGASITEQGWQNSVTNGGSDSWSKWTVGVLSPTTTDTYKLRYYVTYDGTTITSNEVTLNVVGNATSLVLAA